MNASIQDSFNLGWKLALIVKRLASVSLLDSYTEERIPVIAEMLDRTTKIINCTFREERISATENANAWKKTQNGTLMQLGVNYRWSSIVVDEQKKRELSAEEIEYNKVFGIDSDDSDDEEESYAYSNDTYGARSGPRPKAGDRAPDASGLIPITTHTSSPTSTSSFSSTPKPTRFFDLFSATHHTLLAFTPHASRYSSLLPVIARLPVGFMRAGMVLPPGAPVPKGRVEGADFIVVDKMKTAKDSYDVAEGCWIVIVRPDGFIGAIVQEVDGVETYLRKVLRPGVFN